MPAFDPEGGGSPPPPKKKKQLVLACQPTWCHPKILKYEFIVTVWELLLLVIDG